MPSDLGSAHTGLDPARRMWAVLTVGLAVAMSVIDSSIANVALPTIARDLNAEATFAIWIINAYLVTIMLTLLPLSALGEIVGYERVYLGGLVLFTLASLASALSETLPELVVARMLQGLGAAGVMSVNMAVVRFIYPTERLGYGIGINAVIVASSAALGPTIASAILAVAPWPWLFAVNVPIGIGAMAIGVWALPRTPRVRRRFDTISALLSAVTFGLLIHLIETLGHGISPLLFLLELALMAAAGFVLYRRQMSSPAPLLPIDLLAIPVFRLSILTSICSFIAQSMTLVSLPFLLQGNLGFTAVQIGLLITPWPLATSVVAPIAGRLSDRYHVGVLGLIGLLTFASGLAALALLPEHASRMNIAWRMAMVGAGFGLSQSPNNRTIISSAPQGRSGGAAGTQSMARLLGQTIGVALAALLFSLLPERFASVGAVWVGVLFAATGAAVSALRLTDLGRTKS